MSIYLFCRNILFVIITVVLAIFSFSCKEKITDSGDSVLTMRDELTDPNIDPKVVWTFPADKSTGPYTAYNNTSTQYFKVQFNKLMNLNTFTTSSVRIKGFSTSVDLYITQNSSQALNLLQFYVENSRTGNTMNFEIGKTYTVEIDSTVEDIHGKRLGGKYSFSFTPEPSFRIRTAYPSNGDTLLVSQSSSSSASPAVYFNSPITSSSLSAIHLAPAVSGKWLIDTYSKSYAYFSPTSSLAFSTTYTITVDQGMKDAYNNVLPQQYTTSFSTTAFKVNTTSPQDGTVNLSLYSGYAIYIYLSGPVDYTTLDQAFSITPAIQGDLSNSGSNQIVFYINTQLAPGTTYTCRLDTTLKAKNGTALSAPYSFSFSTEKFAVNYSSPNNGSTNVSSNSPISFQFNAPINQSSVASAFSINPSVQGSFSYSSGSNSFSFIPAIALKSGTTYTVNLSTALKSLSGSFLEEPYELQFTTSPFRVTSTSPNNNSYDVNPSYIYVYCSGIIDSGTVRNAFSITPAITGSFSLSSSSSQFAFYPNQQFAMGVKYTVTLSTGLKAKDGTPLQTPYSFSFTTTPFQITGVDPYNGSTGIYRYTSISVSTNANVNISSVSKAFSISPAVTGTFSNSGYGFYFSPQNQLAANTLYTVTVATSLKSAGGDTLQTGTVFSFTTGQ